jgi:hypothetical protein
MVFVAWGGGREKQNHQLNRGSNEVREVEKERRERKREWDRVVEGCSVMMLELFDAGTRPGN